MIGQKVKQLRPRELFPSLEITEVHHLDLSVSSSWLGLKEEFNNLDLFKFKIKQLQKQKPKKILAGRLFRTEITLYIRNLQ